MESILLHKDLVISNLKKYLSDLNITNVVIGISGGIDSAVSLAMLCEVLEPQNIFAYFIDLESKESDRLDAGEIAKSCSVNLNYVNLNNVLETFKQTTGQTSAHANGNVKSRLRMTFLYDSAFTNKALVIGNSNLDELYIGYYTKFGDNGTDFCMLNGFLKRDVFALAEHYKLPNLLQTKKPSAGLQNNQSDEEDLGLKYSEIDAYLAGEKISEESETKIINLYNKNKHKLFYNYDMNANGKYKGILNEKQK
ncbi:MAG: NAD(+) synthase [Mycoplasma sp.]